LTTLCVAERTETKFDEQYLIRRGEEIRVSGLSRAEKAKIRVTASAQKSGLHHYKGPHLKAGSGTLSSREILGLQGTAGNAATTAVIQRVRLTGAKEKQFRNKFHESWPDRNEKEFDEFVAWCATTSQLEQTIEAMSFDEWDLVQREFKGTEANGFPTMKDALAEAKARSGASKPAAVEDPHAMAKKKVKAAGLDASEFTKADFELVESRKDEDGWEKAIQFVWGVKREAEVSAELANDRQQKYAQAKEEGDKVFTSGVLKDLWELSYSVAVSANASQNLSIAGSHKDNAIRPIVTAWRAKNSLVLGQAPGKVTDFHVPGRQKFIEDKSKRPVNPDPTRGRQADFCSMWGNVKINVHMDADPQH
jgi:hypothetical protein